MSDESTEKLEKSYDLSDTGVLKMDGFKIAPSGISSAPNKGGVDIISPVKNMREDLVMIEPIGRGASGVVFKAIHIPTLKMVAVKVIPVFDSSKRHQMIKELKTLYANATPIDDDIHSKTNSCSNIVSFYDAFITPNRLKLHIYLLTYTISHTDSLSLSLYLSIYLFSIHLFLYLSLVYTRAFFPFYIFILCK